MKNYLKEAGNIHLSYYLEAADILDIKYEVLIHKLMARFEYNGRHWFIINTVTPLVNTPGKTIASRKRLTNIVLQKAGLPVPKQQYLNTPEEATSFLEENKSVVLKPEEGLGGRGVAILPEQKDIPEIFSREISSKIIGEEFISGDNYRLLTLGSNVIGAVKRYPAKIECNGKNSIEDLIKKNNSKVPLDKETEKVLSKQGLTLKDIPEDKKVVYLRNNTNLTTGGTTEECLRDVHPYYKDLAVKAVKAIGIEFGGVDLIAEDISKPGKCAINEINYNPGLRIHYQVSKGEKLKVAIPILKYIRDNQT